MASGIGDETPQDLAPDADLQAFREALKRRTLPDVPWAMPTDMDCRRFLRGAGLNVSKAIDTYFKFVQWQIDLRLDSMTLAGLEPELSLGTYRFLGYDNCGHPVIYALPHRHRAKDRDLGRMERVVIFLFHHLTTRATTQGRIPACGNP